MTSSYLTPQCSHVPSQPAFHGGFVVPGPLGRGLSSLRILWPQCLHNGALWPRPPPSYHWLVSQSGVFRRIVICCSQLQTLTGSRRPADRVACPALPVLVPAPENLDHTVSGMLRPRRPRKVPGRHAALIGNFLV